MFNYGQLDKERFLKKSADDGLDTKKQKRPPIFCPPAAKKTRNNFSSPAAIFFARPKSRVAQNGYCNGVPSVEE